MTPLDVAWEAVMGRSGLSIADVVALNDRRKTLLAIRDRLARETDDTRWAQHKRECRCTCGIGDGRVLVALVKELRAVEAELAALPSDEQVSDLDRLADKLADNRATRRTVPAGGEPSTGGGEDPRP